MVARFSSDARTIMDTAHQLRRGDVTSLELTQECLTRADEYDSLIGAYVTRLDEVAVAMAERADAELSGGLDRGPLHGIPIGVKDIIAVSEAETTAQSLVHDRSWERGRDAPAVARLRQAGA